MTLKPTPLRGSLIRTLALTVLLGGMLGGRAAAADPAFEQILATRRVQTVVEQDGLVLTGLDGGGILLWDTEGTVVDRWYAGGQLSGNDVRAMAWTGRHLWVATFGAGTSSRVSPLSPSVDSSGTP